MAKPQVSAEQIAEIALNSNLPAWAHADMKFVCRALLATQAKLEEAEAKLGEERDEALEQVAKMCENPTAYKCRTKQSKKGVWFDYPAEIRAMKGSKA